jgi:hypothetical protein
MMEMPASPHGGQKFGLVREAAGLNHDGHVLDHMERPTPALHLTRVTLAV